MDNLNELANAIRRRNSVDAEIAAIIKRPALTGHVGEFIASGVFGIELEKSATAKGFDGRFRDGSLAGKTVNVKWYAKHEGLLDIRPDALPDYYLVLSGPKGSAASSRGERRPWLIESVYLLDATALVRELQERGVKVGVASSVAAATWAQAQVFPEQCNQELLLTGEQRRQIALFGSAASEPG